MATAFRHSVDIRRPLRQALSFLGTAMLAALVVLLAQHGMRPARASAQSDQPQEVRASAFVLVGPEGGVLARLQAGGNGNGQLLLYDAAGTRRVALLGAGELSINDASGTLHYRAGYTTVSTFGNPPFNGMWLDPQGTIEYLPTTP